MWDVERGKHVWVDTHLAVLQSPAIPRVMPEVLVGEQFA